MDIRPDREMVAVMGAANISTRSYAADTSNPSQVIWSQTTPSVRVGVDRTIEVEMKFTATLSGTIEGGDPSPGSQDAIWLQTADNPQCPPGQAFGFRQYPIHSVIENLQLRLNDQAFNWEPTDTVHALLHYGNTWQDRQYNTGSSPHLPDQFWRYDEVAGAARNEFASWRSQSMEDNRSLKLWAKISATDPRVLEFTLIEQLMISPLNWGEDCQALFGIQNLDVTLTFRDPLYRVFAGDFKSAVTRRNAPTGTDVTQSKDNVRVTVSPTAPGDQKLHITYLQPQANQVVPSRLNYPYYQVRRFQTSISTPFSAAGDIQKVLYNNITLHEIPKRMYVFAAPRVRQSTDTELNTQPRQMALANFFARIEKLRVNFDSQDGRFSTLDSFDLWKMSTKNGLKRSYKQWSDANGSVLCIEFGKDLNLNPLLAPSVRGNFQLSLEVDYKDIREKCLSSVPSSAAYTEALDYTAFLVIVPVGVMTIADQLITTSIGSVTEEQILQAPWMSAGSRVDYQGIMGAGMPTLRNFTKGLAKAAKGAMPIVGPVGDMLGSVLSSQSDPRAQMMGQVVKAASSAAGRGRGGRSSGGRRSGGAATRCSSLARRM
jgi:hypothetical protein